MNPEILAALGAIQGEQLNPMAVLGMMLQQSNADRAFGLDQQEITNRQSNADRRHKLDTIAVTNDARSRQLAARNDARRTDIAERDSKNAQAHQGFLRDQLNKQIILAHDQMQHRDELSQLGALTDIVTRTVNPNPAFVDGLARALGLVIDNSQQEQEAALLEAAQSLDYSAISEMAKSLPATRSTPLY